ncbi:histone-like nucleoid-structuring protein Lsr2 [Nocardia wallacei]|uniref:histone-like nucleoid-structuring protein Lsr2 n=1 Tax=Nocardia wallacei TaxID=480035 RepID=UPI002458DBC1|nr:Lsr2 family protein [Nocardia wallacei]
MARKIHTVVEITDDLTGEVCSNATTVPFSVRGIAYEVDLGPDSEREMDEAFAPFIRKARRVTKKKAAKSARRTRSSESQLIRKWAQDSGHPVPARGRVPEDIVTAYRAAQTSAPEPSAL